MRFEKVPACCLVVLCAVFIKTLDASPISGVDVDIDNNDSDSTSLPQYSVEVLVIVDNVAYEQWLQFQNDHLEDAERDQEAVMAIRDYVRATLAGANLIWKGMEHHGVRLDLRIDDIKIIKHDVILTANADDNSAFNDAAFWEFFRWLIRNGYEYDHALLLTGVNLRAEGGSNSDSEGYAYMDTMCSVRSVSLVENHVNGIPAVVAAHEIAHSFGARHDGNGNNACNATSGYIMNSNNIGTARSHWNFSSCAATAIKAKLEQLIQRQDCVSADSTTAEHLGQDVPYLGQLYTADQLCQMSEGDHSYVCRHLYNQALPKPDDICQTLWCEVNATYCSGLAPADGVPCEADVVGYFETRINRNRHLYNLALPKPDDICQTLWCLVNATYCSGLAPADGVPCGAGSRCLGGICAPFDDVADDVSDACYTGDLPHPAWKNQTCGEVVGSYTHMCSDRWYEDFCCQSCRVVATGDEACPFGDAADWCAPHLCGTRWAAECCATCPPGQ